jgi:hypothetical protein
MISFVVVKKVVIDNVERIEFRLLNLPTTEPVKASQNLLQNRRIFDFFVFG